MMIVVPNSLRRFARGILLAVVVGIGLSCAEICGPAVAVAVPRAPTFVGYTSSAQTLVVRPKGIELTSTDGAALYGGGNAEHQKPIRWEKWTSTLAVGSAVIAIDPCGCARYPDIPTASLSVSLSHPQRLGGHLVFTLMTFTDVRALPGKHLKRPGIDGYPTSFHVHWSRYGYLLENGSYRCLCTG